MSTKKVGSERVPGRVLVSTGEGSGRVLEKGLGEYRERVESGRVPKK